MRRVDVFAAVMALLAGTGGIVLMSMAAAGVPARVLVGAVAGGLVYAMLSRRSSARKTTLKRPFPPEWRRFLEERVVFYRELDPAERTRFEQESAVFLAEQRITGPRGAQLEDELTLLVASAAVILIFGRPGFRYPSLRDIVVYDDAFDDDDFAVSKNGQFEGQVHAQGPILLSARSLLQGFDDAYDGENVGIHEFAHVLDYQAGETDGVPTFMPARLVASWRELVDRESVKAAGGRSLLDDYAAKNEAEFFAVATEAFFERPRGLRRKHPELYGLLRDTFQQDPAARRFRRRIGPAPAS